MRYLYSLLLTMLLPVVFLRLCWRARKLPAYNQRWLERLGIFPDPHIPAGGIWLHAVSVGEVVAAIPLIKALQQNMPDIALTVTTTTPTGSARVRQAFANTVTHVYLPYDLPLFLNNFIQRINPKRLIIMETELWPNLLHVCNQQQIPILIANGRLSDRSFANYRKIKWLIQPMLKNITLVAAQSAQDADRFLQLGLDKDKLHITGNLKFDVDLPERTASLVDRLVWVAASTHNGEEEIVLQVYKQLKPQFPNLLLILVPRHPDRFAEVAALLTKHAVKYVQRSLQQDPTSDTDVLFGDSMGEMQYYYGLADFAFVGGSLVPIGGHNLLEPAAQGVPSITGPHISNFREISAKLANAQAIIVVENVTQLTTTVAAWCADPIARQTAGAQGLQVLKQNRGAMQQVLTLTDQLDRRQALTNG